ncbi:MAG: tripartite tricarboxylate transporter substrate binding protein [Betaproteobacteria bacterium]|nr:tripartite tricarboxylate transporter substrate binding protein [Betaproteobacteria bacterium]
MKRLIPALLLAASFGTAAQAYPTKPIRIVASYPPGGTNDFVARSVGQKLSEMLGQQVLVDNRSGAGGNIGADSVAKAAPDGYTLFMAAGAHALAPSLYKKLSYDLVRDFAPISIASQAAFVLVVNPSVPANNAKDLIQYIKGQPGGVNYAVTGIGVPTHLAGEMFKSLAGLRMTPVAYKGDSPALVDLLGGQVGVSFASIAPALPHIKSQKLRPLAVSTAQRSVILPGIPTVAEATGFADFDVRTWFGLMAPAGTPPEILRTLEAAMVKITALPDIKEKFAAQGMDALSSTSGEFSAFVKDQVQKYAHMVKTANVQPE